MIYYDSHHWWTLLRCKGSIFPKAIKGAFLSAAVTFIIKLLEIQGKLEVNPDLVKNSAAYSGFSFTLGFILVFRTSQSYNRFWVSATSVNAMRTQWFEAASSLIAFVQMSSKPKNELWIFQHRLVRLFSMLNATAIASIASLADENFPVIDAGGFSRKDLEYVFKQDNDKKKAEVVYQWIQALIVQSISSGILNVPPPILTRVFQEMERGMVEFNQLCQIMQIPFPFPYAQVTLVLIYIYMVFTPLVMVLWTNQAWCAAMFTFVSILCISSVNLIATELENPFGDDTNDLPVHLFHHEFNCALVELMNPKLQEPPHLTNAAILDHKMLANALQQLLGGGGNKLKATQSFSMVDLEAMVEEDSSPCTIAVLDEEKERKVLDKKPVPTMAAAQGAASSSAESATAEVSSLMERLVRQLLLHMEQPVGTASCASGAEAGTGGGTLLGSGALPLQLPAQATPISRIGTANTRESLAWQEEFLRKQEIAQQQFLGALTSILDRVDSTHSKTVAAGSADGKSVVQGGLSSRPAGTVMPSCLAVNG